MPQETTIKQANPPGNSVLYRVCAYCHIWQCFLPNKGIVYLATIVYTDVFSLNIWNTRELV